MLLICRKIKHLEELGIQHADQKVKGGIVIRNNGE